MTGDEAVAAAVRAGCSTAGVHLTCTYPECGCKTTPVIVRAAIAEYRRTRTTVEPERSR